MAEPFRYPHRVTYAECTVGDHIYHSRYLDLLEAARGEFMRSLGPTGFGIAGRRLHISRSSRRGCATNFPRATMIC